jgi:hypothetical protein
MELRSSCVVTSTAFLWNPDTIVEPVEQVAYVVRVRTLRDTLILLRSNYVSK